MAGAGGHGRGEEGSDGLTLLELCDIADGLWIAQLERQYLADRQAFASWALSNGDTESEPPSWEERRVTHYAWLADAFESDAEPDILRELGVAA